MLKAINSLKGYSLVELMVGLSLGLFLVGGMIQIFIANKEGYQSQDELSRMQESARFVLETLSNEIRHAGYGGCANRDMVVTNTLKDPGNAFIDFQQGLTGYEGGVDTFPTILNDANSDTDALVVHTVDVDNGYFVTSHNPAAATFHLSSTHTIKSNDSNRPILMVADADCGEMSVFAYTGPTNNNNTVSNVNHNQANTGSPQNCTKALRGGHDCDPAPASNYKGAAYKAGSSLYALSSKAYYIKGSAEDSTVSALYQIPYNGTAEELATYIEDLEFRYGLDTNDDAVPDRYVKAGEINASSTYSWQDVLSVRILLLVRSVSEILDDPQTYSFANTSITSTDKYLRQEYTTTVMIRNRG